MLPSAPTRAGQPSAPTRHSPAEIAARNEKIGHGKNGGSVSVEFSLYWDSILHRHRFIYRGTHHFEYRRLRPAAQGVSPTRYGSPVVRTSGRSTPSSPLALISQTQAGMTPSSPDE